MSDKCEGCGLIGGKEYIRVQTTNGGLCLCRQCLDDVNRKNPALVKILACTSHVKMGRTPDEVCDKVIRAHDEIVALRDRVEALTAALTPFADLAAAVDAWSRLPPETEQLPDYHPLSRLSHSMPPIATIADCRRAAALLAGDAKS